LVKDPFNSLFSVLVGYKDVLVTDAEVKNRVCRRCGVAQVVDTWQASARLWDQTPGAQKRKKGGGGLCVCSQDFVALLPFTCLYLKCFSASST
jgi:hypothetical protein